MASVVARVGRATRAPSRLRPLLLSHGRGAASAAPSPPPPPAAATAAAAAAAAAAEAVARGPYGTIVGPDPSPVAAVRTSLAAAAAAAAAGGGPARAAKRAAAGRLSVRQRLATLLDAGSFTETDALLSTSGADGPVGEGVVTGYGTVSGRRVGVYAQDFTVLGGSLSGGHAAKIAKVMDGAVAAGIPLVGLVDSGGARIQDGVGALAGYTRIFRRAVAASGVVPQVSVVLGACAGGAVYAPALTDWVVMEAGGGSMFLTGPGVVRAVCREEVTGRDLGGAAVHARVSGVVGLVRPGEVDTLRAVRQLLSYLPSNWREAPPRAAAAAAAVEPDVGAGAAVVDEDPALDTVLPSSADAPYDMVSILSRVVDAGSLFPMHHGWAPNVITAFARLGGRPVGVVANQPAHLAGVLDADASVKAARFVRFCDAFGLPLVTFTDVPGFLPGTAQEAGGVIRHGAKLLYAYAEATVPKLGVIVRKAFGGAYCVMSSKELGGDVNYAWPSAAVAVMGARGAVGVLKGGGGAKGGPGTWDNPDLDAEAAYAASYENPLAAVRCGELDAVIPARATRRVLLADLERLADKGRVGHVRGVLPKKHGCIPL